MISQENSDNINWKARALAAERELAGWGSMADLVTKWENEAIAQQARARRAEDALRAFDNIVEKNIRITDGPHRMKGSDGNWHEGPAVDVCVEVLREGQRFVRTVISHQGSGCINEKNNSHQ